VRSDIAPTYRAQEGIQDRMGQDIRVRIAVEATPEGDGDASQNQGASRNQSVHVQPDADPDPEIPRRGHPALSVPRSLALRI